MKYKFIRSLSRHELLSDGKIIFGGLNKDKVRQYISKNEVLYVEKGTTYIDKYAFLNIHGLKEIYLPSTIEEIKEEAFKNCADLEIIHCDSPIVDVKTRAFNKDKYLTVIDMNMRVENDDISKLFTGSSVNNISKTLKSYRLARVEDGTLQIISYQRTDDEKITFSPESTSPIIMGFNEDTREVFELPQQ